MALGAFSGTKIRALLPALAQTPGQAAGGGAPTPAAGADDDMRGETKVAKALPTKDLTRVIWMVTKEKRTKNPTGKVKLDVDYVLDFAGSSVIKDADMVPVNDPIDMAKAFTVINDEDLNRWMAHAEAGWPKTAGAPGQAAGGQQHGGDADGDAVVIGMGAGDDFDLGAGEIEAGGDDAGGQVEFLVDVGELGGGEFLAVEEEADAAKDNTPQARKLPAQVARRMRSRRR